MTATITTDHHRGGSGAPLVLLHGGTNTWHAWEPVLPELERHFDVLAPTLAGHHGGPELAEDAAIGTFVDEVEQMMDAVGFEAAHLAGNSLGGWLAALLAARGRARSLTLIAPAGGWEPGSSTAKRVEAFFLAAHERVRRTRWIIPLAMRSRRLRRAAMKQVMEHGDRLTAARATQSALNSYVCPAKPRMLDIAFREEGAVGEIGDVGCPALIAWAERDRLLRQDTCTAGWTRALPGAEFRVLPGVGHVPMADDPQLIAQTIVGQAAKAEADLARA